MRDCCNVFPDDMGEDEEGLDEDEEDEDDIEGEGDDDDGDVSTYLSFSTCTFSAFSLVALCIIHQNKRSRNWNDELSHSAR